MLTGKDYCDYETCVALWNMGLIPHPYDNTDMDKVMAIISLYEAQKWLREEKGIIVGIINNFTIQAFGWYVSTWEEDICRGNKYVPYEEALSEGIKEAVKFLKENEADKVL